jgi:transposase
VLQTNTVYAARYRHLTNRENNKLTPTQAQSVIAAAVLRQLHAVIVTGKSWDPTIARYGTRRKQETPIAAWRFVAAVKLTDEASPTRH